MRTPRVDLLSTKWLASVLRPRLTCGQRWIAIRRKVRRVVGAYWSPSFGGKVIATTAWR